MCIRDSSGTVLLDQVPVDADLVIDNWRQRDIPNIQGAASQLIQAAIDAGIAEAAIEDAISFVREKARPWIEAKVLTTEIALQASEKLFELAGSRATLAEFNLDRHWRNARVHTLHDPVRWKYHAVGAYHLNGTLPARHSWI